MSLNFSIVRLSTIFHVHVSSNVSGYKYKRVLPWSVIHIILIWDGETEEDTVTFVNTSMGVRQNLPVNFSPVISVRIARQ